jgi:hypothetical protein
MERAESDNFLRSRFGRDLGVARSLGGWMIVAASERRPEEVAPVDPAHPEQAYVYHRNPGLKGPMDGFGYSWFDDHLKKAGLKRPALLSREPVPDGPSYGYEALNLVDGERSVADIAAELSATAGPVPVQEVAEYLLTLERLGAIRR